ncbi:MAG TPA: hypothetical protein PLC40_16425, partial [Candidatus Hydrogenedentes bacterium]|nr:hypothetical protein [Candidatus Hydrogenedentota bacterium]
RNQRGGSPFRPIMAGAIATAVLLYLLSLFNMGFMHHSMPFNGEFRHTLFTGALHEGRWFPFDIQMLFYNDALSMVALNTLLVNGLLYFMWRGDGFRHTRRYTVIIACGTAAVFLLSPLVHALLTPYYFDALNSNHYGTAVLLKLLVGPNMAILPYLGYGLFGVLLGVALARRTPAALMRRYGYGFSVLFLACGAALFMVQGFSPVELAQHPFPIKIHFINLSSMLAFCTWMILRMEYCPEEQRVRAAARTLWLRRMGLVALTAFCLESFVAVLFSRAYLWVLGVEGDFPRTLPYIIPFLVCVLAFWNTLFYFWAKVDFKYSVEWWISRIVCWVRNRPSIRLQTEEVLHRPCRIPGAFAAPLPTVENEKS